MFQVLELDQGIMTNDEVRKARIVLDHVRASVFIVGDGVETVKQRPRLRLAGFCARNGYGRLLNLKHHWLEALIGKVCDNICGSLSDLVIKSEKIFELF